MFNFFSKSKSSSKQNKTAPSSSNSSVSSLPVSRSFHQIKCIGHRGMPCTFPENTLPSFQAAFDSGADGIELDIRLTKDNEVIVLHDATLDRSTTGQGFVSKWTWADLQTIQAKQTYLGYTDCFPSNTPILDYTPPKGPPFAPIPRLIDVFHLILLQKRQDLQMIIDIKWDNPISIMFHLKKILELQEYQILLPRITLGIWSPFFLPFLPTLPVKKSFIGSNLYLAKLCAYGVDTLSIEKDVLIANPTFVQSYQNQSYFISTWTTDAFHDIHQCMTVVGVDALIGDCVGLLVKIRSQLMATTSSSSSLSVDMDKESEDMGVTSSALRQAMISVKNYPKFMLANVSFYLLFACLLILVTFTYLNMPHLFSSRYSNLFSNTSQE